MHRERKFWTVFLLAIVILFGISKEILNRNEITLLQAYNSSKAWVLAEKQFRRLHFLREPENGYSNYTYESLDRKSKPIPDSLGYYPLRGDTYVHHNYISPENSYELYKLHVSAYITEYSSSDIFYDRTLTNEEGTVVGRTGLVKHKENDQTSYTLSWIENGEYWSITSKSVQHIRSFKASEHFQFIKQNEK